MTPDSVTVHKDRCALFLDVDGILLSIAESPPVCVFEDIKKLLVALTPVASAPSRTTKPRPGASLVSEKSTSAVQVMV